jgi:Mg-chelatase subunit ChlD
MPVRRSTGGIRKLSVCAAAAVAGALPGGCKDESESTARRPGGGSRREATREVQLPRVDARLCTAVVLLIDTSGSMGQRVPDKGGVSCPKFEIAADALARIVEQTTAWRARHPDRLLQLGLYSFSSSPREVLPMSEFDTAAASAALEGVPAPGGGTGIGRAMEMGFKSLYASGCVRKHLVCITVGENTSGPAPDRVARQLHAQTEGEVELHFLAFDTSAQHFAFLREVNGEVVEASDGAQLQAQLTRNVFWLRPCRPSSLEHIRWEETQWRHNQKRLSTSRWSFWSVVWSASRFGGAIFWRRRARPSPAEAGRPPVTFSRRGVRNRALPARLRRARKRQMRPASRR